MRAAVWLLALLSLSYAADALKTESSSPEDAVAVEKVRGLYHGLKKVLKKNLMPALLIAYKLKALLGFVSTGMSISALGTASGLAGLFFALFAVAICTVVEHEHHRHARFARREDELADPQILRALEAI